MNTEIMTKTKTTYDLIQVTIVNNTITEYRKLPGGEIVTVVLYNTAGKMGEYFYAD